MEQETNCAQTYSIKAGIKKCKEKVKESVKQDMDQLHKRIVFAPIHPKDLTETKGRKLWKA